MMYMGGLRKAMPWTYVLTVIGALSLVGIFPLAGFWSKDEILLESWLDAGGVPRSVSLVVFFALLAGVVLTAFYSLRMVHLTFHGEFRGGGEQELQDVEAAGQAAPTGVTHHVHLGESPIVMVAPMFLLGVSAIIAGWLANPIGVSSLFGLIPSHWLTEYLASGLHGEHHPAPFSIAMAVASNVVALVGIGFGGSDIRLAPALRVAGPTDESRPHPYGAGAAVLLRSPLRRGFGQYRFLPHHGRHHRLD
jgi:NADH:ubiquinone oxidoreductase subunit 5 (subunit L)/multisubunit Na+/H+ antiporter MnhA subunit